MAELQVDLWNYVPGSFKLRLVESYISSMLCQAIYAVESCDRSRVATILSTSVRVYSSEGALVYQVLPSEGVSSCLSGSSSCKDRYQLLWMEALLTQGISWYCLMLQDQTDVEELVMSISMPDAIARLQDQAHLTSLHVAPGGAPTLEAVHSVDHPTSEE